jgi:outer membrane protein OmpA-like peptidoglycan-associated protein
VYPSFLKALLLVFVGLLAAGARAAEPVSEEKVREDLDRQLREMVRTPPPEVVVSFEGLPKEEGYKLVESEFLLDGQPLIVPGPETLTNPGLHRLAVLTVEEGTHTLVSQVTYVNDSWSLFSDTSGRLWKMTATVSFQTQRGLRVNARVVPGVVPNAPDPRLKIKLRHDVTVEMTAKLADATPEPPPDAGTPPPQVAQAEAPPAPEAPRSNVQVVSGTVPAAPGAARMLVKVTSRQKPVAATVLLRGPGKPQQLSLDWKARKPTRLELAPGTYAVDVIAKGFLAQSRRLVVTQGQEARLFVSLVRAPKRKLQQVRVKGERVELPKAPRFNERQAAPRKGTTTALALLVDMLVRDGAARLRIEGHTYSRDGSESALKQLSEARAKALAEQLVRAGVDPSRIETAGFADSRPKAPNLTAPGRQLNRRVEFLLLRK